MTVSTTNNKVSYPGTGAASVWSFSFPVLDESDMQVWLTDALGTTTQVFTNFSVDLINKHVTYPVTPTIPQPIVPLGTTITLYRFVPFTQLTDINNQTAVYADTEEGVWDRLTMMVQQVQEQIGRSLIAGISAVANYMLPGPLANAIIGWNSSGTGLENKMGVVAGAWSAADIQQSITVSKGGGTIPGTLSVTGALTGTLTGTATNITGITAVANGGSGSATAAGARTNLGAAPVTFNSLSQFLSKVTSNTLASITAANNPFTGSGSISVTLNTANVGANGLDTSVLAASQFYYTYLCYGASGVCSLMSLSSTAPMLPAGYNLQFVRVGAVLLDASKYLMRINQNGRRAQYVVTPATNTAALPQMSSGNIGTTLIAFPIAAYAPPTAGRFQGFISSGTSNGTGNYTCAAPNGSYGAASSANSPPVVVGDTSVYSATSFDFMLESASIWYSCYASTGYLNAMGWEDNL